MKIECLRRGAENAEETNKNAELFGLGAFGKHYCFKYFRIKAIN